MARRSSTSAQSHIVDVENVEPEIEAIKALGELTEVSCYDCHNRVGHDITNPRDAVDYMLQVGTIDDSLPFIKRESMRILWAAYPDEAAAFAEIDALEAWYQVNYPDIYATKLAQIRGAIVALKDLYPQTALPAMQVTPATYAEPEGAPGLPGLLPLPRRRALPGGGWGCDQGIDPVHLQHVPHVPADRAGGCLSAVGPAAEHAPGRSLGVQPCERGDLDRPGADDVRGVPCAGLLRELPLDGRDLDRA